MTTFQPNTGANPPTWTLGVLSFLTTIGVVYVVSRTFGLDQSLWEDEIYTATHYIGDSLGRAFDPEAYISNNHPLYNLLVTGFTRLLGDSEVLLRLGSLVPATIAAGILTYWLWCHLGAVPALALAFLITVSPLHFETFRQARGWGLALLGITTVLVSSLEVERQDSLAWPTAAVYVLGALTAIWAIYALILPVAVHGIILMVTRRERLRLAAVASLIVLGSVTFYWPLRNVLRDPAAIRGQGAPSGSERDGFVTFGNLMSEPFDRLITPIFSLASPTPIAVIVGVALSLGGGFILVRRGNGRMLLHLALPVVIVFLGLATRNAGIWDRYVSFLLPHALTLLALGTSAAWSPPEQIRMRAVSHGAFLLLSLVVLVGFIQYAIPIVSTPRENFKGAAALIDGAAPVRGAFTQRLVSEFNYNLELVELEEVPKDTFYELSCEQTGPAVFVDYPRRSPPADTSCLAARGVRVVLPQRQSPPISVWLIP